MRFPVESRGVMVVMLKGVSEDHGRYDTRNALAVSM